PADHLLDLARPALARQTLLFSQIGLVADQAFLFKYFFALVVARRRGARRRTRFEVGREVIDQDLFLRFGRDCAPPDHLLDFARPALSRQSLRDDQVGLVATDAPVTGKFRAFAFRHVLPGRAGVRADQTAGGYRQRERQFDHARFTL